MDFIEYAKWGIRVKEEPGTLGPLQRDKPTENNIRGPQRGWMCKFPCDAQGVLDSAVATTNEPYELLEPFEPSPVNYLGEGHEYFNLQDSDKFTSFTVSEGSNNIPQENPAHIIQQEVPLKDYAVFRSTLEENNTITGLSSSKGSLKDNEKQMLDAVLNVQYDILEDIPPTADHIYQREIVQSLPKNTVSKRPNEDSFMVKNQSEILCPSDMELLFGAPESAVVELVKNSGRMEMSLNVENNLSREIESLAGEHVVTAHQENSQKENNNDFRISEISSFECPDCGAVLKSFNSFITHMNSHIIEQRENVDNVQCENCNKIFNDDRSLSLHKEECNSAKESNMPSPKKRNNNINNNVVCVSVNCSETNSSGKQYALGNHSELALSSHSRESSPKKIPEQQRHHEDLSSCTPKRRRQVYTPECSSSETPKSRNNWTMQNLGDADDAFDVSWSSEIKCRDKREGRSVGSVRTLSLRLFRFRRPRVVVKRAQVPARSESVIKTLNASLGDSVSYNTINQKSICQIENVENLKRLTNERETSEVNKIHKSEPKVDNCSNDVQPNRKQKHVLHSEKGWQFSRSHEMTGAKKSHSQVNSTPGHSDPQNIEPVFSDTLCSFPSKIYEKDKKSSDDVLNASSKFATKDTKVRSNLKIKIKPVVVLDRLSTLNLISNKSLEENTSKCVGGVSSHKNLPNGMNITNDSNALEKFKIPSDETNSKKIVKIDVDQSAKHLDSCHNAIGQRGNSLTDLEKRFGIKKCYVKLKRISVESCNLTKIVKHDRDETGCEMKTCGKIKLRRMSSKLWTVSSCTSELENTEVAEYTEDRIKTANWLCVPKDTGQCHSHQEVHNKINGQRSKKFIDSKGPSISLTESSGKTLNDIQRGKRIKNFRSECTCCKKIFFDEQDLAQHLESHLSGYKCPNCSARFHFVMELNAHVAGCSLASLLDCHKPESLIKPCQVVL